MSDKTLGQVAFEAWLNESVGPGGVMATQADAIRYLIDQMEVLALAIENLQERAQVSGRARIHVWENGRQSRNTAVIEAAKRWKAGWLYPLCSASDPGDWELWQALEALEKAEK